MDVSVVDLDDNGVVVGTHCSLFNDCPLGFGAKGRGDERDVRTAKATCSRVYSGRRRRVIEAVEVAVQHPVKDLLTPGVIRLEFVPD